MARDKALQANIDGGDLPNFPNKRIRDNDGSGNGTPVNEVVYGDHHEFFAQIMRLYGILYNALPDQATNGYQLVDALIAVASKNDFILNLTESGGVLQVPLKLGFVLEGESFVCLAQVNKAAETQIQGTLDAVPVLKNITFKGAAFKTGEYLRLVITATGVDLIRLSDGDALDTIAAELGYLKKATQIEEDAGAIDTKATTPLSNFTAFSDRVIGAQSVNFLVTTIANGLMSFADKVKLDALSAAPISARETITIDPVSFSSSTNNSHSLGGVPFLVQTFIECKTTHTFGGRTYSVGERVAISEQHDSENNDIRAVQNTLKTASIDTLVTTIKIFQSSVTSGTNGGNIIEANWKLIIELFR